MNVAPKFSYNPSQTHAEDTPYTVQRDRLKNGQCPDCGAQVNNVKKSITGRKLEPLTIPGKVDRGRCLVCHPNVFATPAAASIPQGPSNERRRVKKNFHFANGLKAEYDGEVDDVGRKHGYGTIRYSNGDSYVGHWWNDLKEGHGEYKWADGNVHVGEYRNDKREGRGKWTCHDGSDCDGDVYEGEFKDDKREGWAKYIHHKSGNVYEGGWKNGKREGRGTATFGSNGDVREGRYRNGFEHGKAIYRSKGGDVYDEVWDNGELVSEKMRWNS